jgi:hypothetical protein
MGAFPQPQQGVAHNVTSDFGTNVSWHSFLVLWKLYPDSSFFAMLSGMIGTLFPRKELSAVLYVRL